MFYVMDNGTDYWFNMFSIENEANFRLIGILLGLAIYNSIILDVHFPITIYRKLLNCTPTMDDMHASHPVSSVCLFVCLFVCLIVCLFVHSFIYLFVVYLLILLANGQKFRRYPRIRGR